MSVFLTPDLKPIIGGTYFPPDDRHGQTGFKTILLYIAEKVQEKKFIYIGMHEKEFKNLQLATKISVQ